MLVPALGAVQGGYSPDAWVWSGALAAWACGLAVVLSSSPGALRRAWPWAAATGALLLWTLLSATWSAHPAQSVLESRRTLLYAAVVLALVLLARRDTQRLLVPATHVAITALLVYALARYLFGTRRYDEFEQYLIQQPLGYANAVGILSVLGLLLALGIVAGPAPVSGRAAAAATVPVLALTLDFSGSTASLLALGVGLAVLALLAPATLRLVAAGAVLLPAAAIAAGVGSASRFAAIVTTPRIPGWAVAVVALACAALRRRRCRAHPAPRRAAAVAPPAPAPPRRGARRRARRSRRHRAFRHGGAALVVLPRRLARRVPRPSPGRHRRRDVRALLGVIRQGTRPGRCARRALALPRDARGARAARSPAPARDAPRAAPRRARATSAPYVPAAVAAYAAFLVHAGLDWDWELPAVVVAALCCAGAVTAAELEPGRPLGRAARGTLLAVSAAFAACAIAGARSNTIPAAAPETTRAPHRGALSQTRA